MIIIILHMSGIVCILSIYLALPGSRGIHQSTSCVQVQDPVKTSPAVLIKRYNISQQKELELQLASQQMALQR